MTRPPSDGVQRTARWVVLAILGYALFHVSYGMYSQSKAPISAGAQPLAGAAQTKDCAPLPSNPLKDLSIFAMPLLPTSVPAIQIEDIKEGIGVPAMCGQHAIVKYEYAVKGGSVIFSNLTGKKTQDIVLGGNATLPGFERGLIGMKPGGERRMLIPASLAFGAVKDVHALQDNVQFKLSDISDIKSKNILAKASLVAVSPGLPQSVMPMRVVDHNVGQGLRAQCGDKVSIDMTLWKVDGTPLFSTLDSGTPISFVIGASQMPYGIEEGVIGMMETGQRMLIVPPSYMTPLALSSGNKMPFAAAVPANEVVLVALDLRQVGDALAKPAP